MANEFKVKNGVMFPDGTVQTTAASGANFIKKTSNYTAAKGESIIADTTSGGFTITLPVSPTEGSCIVIADGNDWSVNNLTVARNGSTIENLSDDLVLDVGKISLTFIYDGTTWEVFAQAGVYNPAGGGGGTTAASGFETTFLLMGA